MVWIVVKENREIQRLKPKDGRIEDSPDTKTETKMARDLAKDIPALILLRQNGDEEKGWTGHPFWWPVLVTPSDTKTVVFTSEQLEVED